MHLTGSLPSCSVMKALRIRAADVPYRTVVVLNNTMQSKRTFPKAEIREWRNPASDALRRSSAAVPQDLAPLHDVNERCIEMLAQAARKIGPGSPPLVLLLEDLLKRLTPETRARAARRAVLLCDLQFANPSWWRLARTQPKRPVPLLPEQGVFPRAAALQLARSTLLLAWHTLRSSPQSAVLLGVHPSIAEVISGLSLSDIELLVERRFRHVRPRWEDRPAVWRGLLLAAESENVRKAQEVNLYSLLLLTGDLWSPASPGCFKAAT